VGALVVGALVVGAFVVGDCVVGKFVDRSSHTGVSKHWKNSDLNWSILWPSSLMKTSGRMGWFQQF